MSGLTLKESEKSSLTCYLDDSYDRVAGITTIAGYFSYSENWADFETSLEGIFAESGVEVFHAIDFKAGRGDFRGWSREEKNQLIKSIFYCAKRSLLFGISVSVLQGASASFKKAHKSHSNLSAYGMAFSLLASKICTISEFPMPRRKIPVHFRIEEGNKNNADIRRIFLSNSVKNPIYNSLQFIEKSSCKAIQIADFLAFYSRRSAKNILSRPDHIAPDFPPEIEAAATYTPHVFDVLTGRTLIRVIERKRSATVGPNRQVFSQPRDWHETY